MRLSQGVFLSVTDRIMFLDTSAILSATDILGCQGRKVITSAVLRELKYLSDSSLLAKSQYEKVKKLISAGKILLWNSEAEESFDRALSPTDANLIKVASSVKKAVIASCDERLCAMAQRHGVPTISVRTNVS